MLVSLFAGGFSESDDLTAEIIASALASEVGIERLSYNGDPKKLCEMFVEWDWFLAARYHGAIAAYLSGGNLAVIPYNRKVADLADEIGLPEVRRVKADAPQPVSVWLNVLRSFEKDDPTKTLLDPAVASARAESGLMRVLQATSTAYMGKG